MIATQLKLPRFIQIEKLSGLRIKLLTGLILSGIVPLIITGVIAYQATVSIMEQQASLAGTGVLKTITGNVEQLTGNIEMIASQIASDPDLAKSLAALDNLLPGTADRESLIVKINGLFQPWLASNPEIRRIMILGNPRQTINYPGNDPAGFAKISGASWYRKSIALNGRPLWAMSLPELAHGPESGFNCLRFIPGTGSGLNCLLIIQLDSQAVGRIVSRTLFAGGGKVYLMAPGAVFKADPARPDKADRGLQNLRKFMAGTEFQKRIGHGRPVTFRRASQNNTTVLYQPLRIPGWFLLGTVSEPEWTGPFLATKFGYVILIILLSGLVIWGSLAFSKYWAATLPGMDTLKQQAAGVCTSFPQIRREDELGLLAKVSGRVFEKFKRITADADLATRELSSITGQIIDQSREVTQYSASISSTLEELTEATVNEAAEVSGCVSNISLLTESIHIVNDYAALIQKMKTDILELISQGKAALENLERRSHETKTITIDINRLIYNLNEQTQEIQDIVAKIREIVVQTDMISLNATIEATRIKDIKKEVLALAHDVKKHVDYSASATRKITEVILRIENKTTQATAMAEVANEAVESQTGIIQQCTQVFNDIRSATDLLVEKFEAVIELMTMVEANKNEIMGLTGAISGATEQIAAMTEKVSISFQKERRTMENLAADAGELENCMANLQAIVRDQNQS